MCAIGSQFALRVIRSWPFHGRRCSKRDFIMRKVLVVAAIAALVGLSSRAAQAEIYSTRNPYASFNRAANYSADRWQRQHDAAMVGTYGNYYGPGYGYSSGYGYSGAPLAPAGTYSYRSGYGGWNAGPGYSAPVSGGSWYGPSYSGSCR
jgi:hypothetical protein